MTNERDEADAARLFYAAQRQYQYEQSLIEEVMAAFPTLTEQEARKPLELAGGI
jgi:hypothetical protein